MSHDNGTETFTVAEVEAMFREAVPVKRSAVREVRRHGDYFIKFDRRNNHGFAREFATARRLKEAGLPVVNHLFCGQGENGHYLVTGSFADSVAVDDFLRTELPDMAFFETIADLAKSLLGKGFLHADFHLGNLLYNTRSRTFALVDVRQVRQMPLWLLNNLPESSRFHVLTEFRGVLRRRELLQLFRRVGVAKPGNFYEDMLSADNAAIRDEAKKTGIRAATINELYNEVTDRVSLNQLDRICQVLECDLTDLLKRDGHDPFSETGRPT